jgi:pimeloyl-ACP methyl ester carboxylesterase
MARPIPNGEAILHPATADVQQGRRAAMGCAGRWNNRGGGTNSLVAALARRLLMFHRRRFFVDQVSGRPRRFSIPAGPADWPVGNPGKARAGRSQRLAAFSLLAALTSLACTSPEDPAPAAPNPQGADAGGREQRVDVGGYKLTLLTRGQGTPTVVIEPGMGLPGVENDEWKAVCDEIAKTTGVCLYDRAGLGTSDPAPTRPRTCRDVARDLHNLLANAKVPGPYVLVGHSIGGLNVRVFADMYPDEVAGVVLVDATHPDQESKWQAALPAESPEELPALKQSREHLASRLADRGDNNPDGLDLVASREQVRAIGTMGDKPLAVLTHSPEWKMVPDLPDDILKPLEQVSQDLQAGMPALSTDSSHKVAEKAGHGIHVDEPGLVVEAIREVLGKVKANPTK